MRLTLYKGSLARRSELDRGIDRVVWGRKNKESPDVVSGPSLSY